MSIKLSIKPKGSAIRKRGPVYINLALTGRHAKKFRCCLEARDVDPIAALEEAFDSSMTSLNEAFEVTPN